MCGCQSTPRERAPAETTADLATAAPEPGLAELSDSAAARDTLTSAEQLFTAGDWVGAIALFSVVTPTDLPPKDRPRYQLLEALVAIQTGDLDGARALLRSLDARQLPNPIDATLANARLVAADGQPANAARLLMREPATPASSQRLNDTIWALLSLTYAFEALASSEPARARQTTAIDSGLDNGMDTGMDVERGWWALRRELLLSSNHADQLRRLDAWRAAWPEHPATRYPPAPLRALEAGHVAAQRVALLLPTTGPLARAGRAIRDGFIATYLEHAQDHSFELIVYDTAAAPLSVIYERALADRADALIGPLRREEVAAMNDLAPEVPVLALNYLGAELPAATLVQLGLAIEDDAATIADWLLASNQQQVLIFQGPHDWATRARQVLDDRGIQTIGVHSLSDMRTVTDRVGEAMDIAASQSRHSELVALLGTPIEFTPRARKDVQALVALVDAGEIDALVPALRFHYANTIPTYVTSQTLQGAGATALRNLEGFRIAELPWRLPGDPVYASLGSAFMLDGNPFGSMYALGADAYRLVDRILPANREGFTQLIGSTGALTLSPDGRVKRELARMQLSRGQLTLAPAAGQ